MAMLNYQMVTVVSLESLNKQKGPTWIQHQSDIVWYQLRQQLCVSNWVASSSSSASSSNWGRSILVLCINIGGNLGPRTTKKKQTNIAFLLPALFFFWVSVLHTENPEALWNHKTCGRAMASYTGATAAPHEKPSDSAVVFPTGEMARNHQLNISWMSILTWSLISFAL